MSKRFNREITKEENQINIGPFVHAKKSIWGIYNYLR